MATNRNTSRKADAPRIVISGGGTGGHIFPAVSIAGAVRTLCPQAEILFVGAEGRMEMQRVPEAGYPIIGLPVAGFDRSHLWRNVAVVRKLLGSLWQARRIVRDFRPHVAVGVGGYASGPTLYMASRMGVPTLLQEQNSYAGVTNRLLAKRASKICVAYDGMEAFFPKDKILLTGNPVRQNLLDGNLTRAEAAAAFGLDPALKTVLVVGGSLGARTINRTVAAMLPALRQRPRVQLIWQTGKGYVDEVRRAIQSATGAEQTGTSIPGLPGVYVSAFLSDMARAYRAADLVVSRAGAGSISELCLLGKAAVLVPSPNVAEDHQTKNALALSTKGAALFVGDADAAGKLPSAIFDTLEDDDLLESLSHNAASLSMPHAAETIAREVLSLAGWAV